MARRLTRIGFVAALAAAAVTAAAEPRAAHSADAPPGLLGRWEAAARSHGGIGQIVEFQKDGTMIHWFAAIVDSTYRIEGGRLVQSFKESESAPVSEVTVAVSFDGPVLIQRDVKSGEELRMTRVDGGASQDQSIVGTWSYPHETGPTAYIMYTSDGRMLFRLPIKASRGRWSITGDRLFMGLSPAALTPYRYEIQAGKLLLTDNDGVQSTYIRAEITVYK